MKLLIDISKLEAEGKVTPDQATAIRTFAAAETTSLAINVLSLFGVAAIVGGTVALAPKAVVAGGLGAGLMAFGIGLRWFKPGTFGLLADSLVLIGAVLHYSGVVDEWDGSALSFMAQAQAEEGALTTVLIAVERQRTDGGRNLRYERKHPTPRSEALALEF